MLKPRSQGHGIRKLDLGRWLGHEGATLMNGIGDLIKGVQVSLLAPSTMWGHSKNVVIYQQEYTFSTHMESENAMILDFPANWEK
jgi:hypothetical protein